jgi:hypothetical protein
MASKMGVPSQPVTTTDTSAGSTTPPAPVPQTGVEGQIADLRKQRDEAREAGDYTLHDALTDQIAGIQDNLASS